MRAALRGSFVLSVLAAVGVARDGTGNYDHGITEAVVAPTAVLHHMHLGKRGHSDEGDTETSPEEAKGDESATTTTRSNIAAYATPSSRGDDDSDADERPGRVVVVSVDGTMFTTYAPFSTITSTLKRSASASPTKAALTTTLLQATDSTPEPHSDPYAGIPDKKDVDQGESAACDIHRVGPIGSLVVFLAMAMAI